MAYINDNKQLKEQVLWEITRLQNLAVMQMEIGNIWGDCFVSELPQIFIIQNLPTLLSLLSAGTWLKEDLDILADNVHSGLSYLHKQSIFQAVSLSNVALVTAKAKSFKIMSCGLDKFLNFNDFQHFTKPKPQEYNIGYEEHDWWDFGVMLYNVTHYPETYILGSSIPPIDANETSTHKIYLHYCLQDCKQAAANYHSNS